MPRALRVERARRILTRVATAATLLVAPACSSTGDEPATDSATQAIAADWIHPACQASALAPPANDAQLCNGPWAYSYQEWWFDHTACGDTTTCTVRNACTSWDANTVGDGIGYTVATTVEPGAGHTYFCPARNGLCHGDMPGTSCPADATARRNALIAARPGISPQALAGFTVTWAETNIVVEIDPEPPEGGGAHASTTTYDCQLTIHNFPSPRTDARPACSCAQFAPAECKRGGVTPVFTAPGGHIPGGPGAPSAGSSRREYVAAPSCTTCDQTAFDSPANAQTKFQCLDGSLAAAGRPADVISSVAARMELLLQMAGDRLTAAQRTRAEAVYNDNPGATMACRTPIAWTPACQTEATPLHLPGQVQLCEDLATNAGTTRESATTELPHCLAQLATVDQLTTDGCRLATRDAADAAAQGVLARAQPDYVNNLATALPIALARVNTWWSSARVAARADTGWLVEHSSAVTRTLWASLEQSRITLPTSTTPGVGALTTDAQAATLLADIFDTGLADDVAVLAALFADAQTQTSPVLLTMTGDSLRGLADRLARLEAIHDVGCRFAACRTATTLRSSATSELVHALASLTDPAALSAVLGAASKLQQQQPAIHAALGLLQAHHARLTAAWTALGRTDPFTGLVRVVDPPAEVVSLAQVVREAALAWGSYQSSGEFSPGHQPRLTAATLEQSLVMDNLDRLIAGVTTANTNFTGARLASVNDVLDQIQHATTIKSIQNRDNELRVQFGDVISRSLGLEDREAGERAALAKFQQAFEALAGALDQTAVFHTQSLPPNSPPLRVSAADAHFPITASDHVLGRDQFHTETLHSGEALRLHVTGSWSPSCAISKAFVADPATANQLPIVLPVPALTGPNGYWASLEASDYRAHAVAQDSSSRLDIGVSIEACAATPGMSVTGNGVKACAHINYDQTWSGSDTSTNGNQNRFAASFATGIRVDQTPFPVAPAGSLVAVVTRAGSTLDVIDVRVVQPDDVIVAPALPAGAGDSVDVHLVVNDAVADCTPDTSDQLQIDMIKTTPFGNVAQALGAAMASTLAAIEADAPAILAQGQLTADESTALRSDAWARVQEALPIGLGLADLPPDLRQLFEAFLDREIASLARRGEMHAASLQREQILLEFAADEDELAFADQQSRLSFLVPRWRLRDLSGVQLAQATDALTQSLSAYVAPIFQLRDPAHYTTFPSQVASQLSQLVDVNLTAPLEGQVANLVAFAQTTRNALASAVFELPNTARRTLVIAIPRPPTTTVPNPQAPPWHTVSDATASAFWASVLDKDGKLSHAATLTLSPGDLYVFGGDNATLACATSTSSDLAPVVRRAALYLDTQALVSNSLGIELPTREASLAGVTFPIVGQNVVLTSDDPRGIALSLPVLCGSSAEVLDKFSPPGAADPGLGAGAGLSPFTSFVFDMTQLGSTGAKPVWDGTQALYLVFEVERQFSLDPPWVEGVCVMRDPIEGGGGGPAGGQGGT